MDPVQNFLAQVDRLVRIDWATVAEDIRRVEEVTRVVAEAKPAVPATVTKGEFSWMYLSILESFIENPTKVPDGIQNVGEEDRELLIAGHAGMDRLAMLPPWADGKPLPKDYHEWLIKLLVNDGRARYWERSEEAIRLFKSFGNGKLSAFSVLETAGLTEKEILQSLAELEVSIFRVTDFWSISLSRLIYLDPARNRAWALALCYAQRAWGEKWSTKHNRTSVKNTRFLEAMQMLGISVPDVESEEDWKDAIDEAIASYEASSEVSFEMRNHVKAYLLWSVMPHSHAVSIQSSMLLGMALARYPHARELWRDLAVQNLTAWDSMSNEEEAFTGMWSLTSPVVCMGLRTFEGRPDMAALVDKGRVERYLDNLEEEIRGVRGMFIERNPEPAETPAIEEAAPTTEQHPLISFLTEHRVFVDLDPKWYSYVLRESFPFSEIRVFETLMAAKAKKEGV